MYVTYQTQSCGTFQQLSGGYSSAIEVSQAQYTGSTIDSFAASFVCVNSTYAIAGTVVYKMTNSTAGRGYYVFGTAGDLAGFGNDNYLVYLSDPSYLPLAKPIQGMAVDQGGGGYWMVASDGGIFNYGDAHFYGSAGNLTLTKPIVGMAATPDGKGYWLVASDGGIFNYGDAHFYGSAGNLKLVKPIVGMAPTTDGKGYWMVASDGGVFNYGDAHFYGSTGNIHLVQPIEGMQPTADGKGYWFVAYDGGIFNFGDAHFYGSLGADGVTGVIGIVR
jgi:hypothetical protein